MEKPVINYETLIRITKAISMIRDPEEIVLITVEGITHALKVKGCTLFLYSEKTDELKLNDNVLMQPLQMDLPLTNLLNLSIQ